MKNFIRICIALSLSAAMFAQAPAAKKPAAKSPAKNTMATAAPSGPVALRGGKLLTISHGVVENGVVVIENGKITAVGGPEQRFRRTRALSIAPA